MFQLFILSSEDHGPILPVGRYMERAVVFWCLTLSSLLLQH
jgi:hypothetical protein